MPKKQTKGRPPAANARLELVLQIMDDLSIILSPVETGKKDGFEVVDHPEALKDVWKVANDFPPISTGAGNADRRRQFYSRFRNIIRVKGAFRKGGTENNKLWNIIQAKLSQLEATG